ncbi:MAG TPA: M13 family metallopeptidase [Ignavibacteriaceae bacterium]|nr:M13 family metallopeptidase [Ignavibacteriaceae bacterium]
MNKISILLYGFILALIISTHILYSQQKEKGDFLTAVMDTTVDPGVNFFEYATGTWMKENPIPSSERRWGLSDLVNEETYNRLKGILQEAAASNAPEGSKQQKIGDFYYTGMDTIAIEKQDLTPIKRELDKINSIKNKKDLFNTVAFLQREGVNLMFSIFVQQDTKNSEQWALYLWQGGLGLPNREYYFRDDTRTKNIRNEYKVHVAHMLKLLGKNKKEANVENNKIYAIENFLADSCRKLEDLRDPYANYNKMSIEDLEKLAPAVEWKLILNDIGASNVDSIIVGQPEFFHELNAAINKFDLDQWKAYLKFHLLSEFAGTLASSYDNESFHFRGTIMSGIKEQKPRWKRTQDAVEGAMGELLGQIYVEKYYSPKTKKRYEKIVDDCIDAFANRIKNLDWMSDSTKQKALNKLYAVTKKVGYPDRWKDFSKLKVDRSSFCRNTINADIFWFDRDMNKIGKPVDRTEWDMTPQTWNAYYNPSNNEIVLPAAAFIVPGVPDSLVDDAVAYAYAGASTISHELTHGFDDEGRLFDEKGNLHNWWTKEDEEKFNAKTKLLVEQFDNYVVLDSMHINGKATLGENLADLGGDVIGWDAFTKTKEYNEGKKIAGLAPAQRFWIGYAYSWLGHTRPEALAQQVLTDVHSPNFLRVNGPFSDVDAFYKAFNIKPGQPMYIPPEKRVRIW